MVYSWFQTSLSLASLPIHLVITACCFRVAALSSHPILAYSQSGIALKLNRIQPSAVYYFGQKWLSIDWQDNAYRLVFPLQRVVLEQLYKHHHQSGNVASGKLSRMFSFSMFSLHFVPYLRRYFNLDVYIVVAKAKTINPTNSFTN